MANLDSSENITDNQKNKILDNLMNRKQKRNSHVVQAYTIKDPIEDFQNNSPGIFYYFYFLKFFGIIFLIISLISIYPIVLNSVGGNLE